MRKWFVAFGLVLMLALPLSAQAYTGCCHNDKIGYYPAGSVTVFGPLDANGCIAESKDPWTDGACPTPTAVPTAVPTPAPYEPPNSVEVPSWIKTIISIFAPKFIIPFAALISTAVITLTQLLKQLLAWFGAKLSPKWNYVFAALMSLLTVIGTVANQGYIEGSMWLVLLTAVLTFFGSIFGYKFTFSSTAKAKYAMRIAK